MGFALFYYLKCSKNAGYEFQRYLARNLHEGMVFLIQILRDINLKISSLPQMHSLSKKKEKY